MKKTDRHTKFFLAALIVIPSLMILLWCVTSNCLKRAERDIGNALDNALGTADVGNTAEIESALTELTDVWTYHSDNLLLFLNHGEINEVELGIAMFCSAVRCGDIDSAVCNSVQIKTMLEMMSCYDEISIKNIL